MCEEVSKNSLVKGLLLSFLLVFTILVMAGSSMVAYAQGSLSVQTKNVSDNSPAYGGIYSWEVSTGIRLATAGQYLEVSYESSESLWSIDIYTDNVNWKGGSQRGGLVTADGKQRVPLMWRVYNDVQPGGVVFTTTTDWALLKDKGDMDDPGTTQYDESWVGAFSTGYVNICYGGPGYTNLALYPNDPPDVRLASSPIYVYLGGLFGSVGAGEYSTIIRFDLYHIAPEDKPAISHTPIERIGILGDKIVFNATITDDDSVESATIHYKIGRSGEWQSGAMVLKGSPMEKAATFVLPPQRLPGPCQIRYWLEARDGNGNIGKWKDESSPQIIEVTQSITQIVGLKGGKVILLDVNPDDGEIMVDIPGGALNKDTKITIEQITDLSRIPDYSEAEDWQPVAIYNFTQEGLKFKKAVTMSLLYFDMDNDGKPEDWKGDEKGFNESQLACYWWDGITWRPVGGKVDRDRNIVTVKVSHFTYYGLFKTRPMANSEYRPKEKIITPAYADGKNDVAYFSGVSGQDTTIKIYDVTGKKIRTINGEPYEWDGTDEDGNIVESGVYIYQFKADVNGKKRLVSGTIVVAK